MSNLAHATHNHENTQITQTLLEHSLNVAKIASVFASKFSNADWAALAALLHDIGKANPAWQAYLQKVSFGASDYLPDISERGSHSTAGALYLTEKLYSQKSPCSKDSLTALFMSYLIAGHHAGLLDFNNGEGASLTERIFAANAKEELNKLSLEADEKQLLNIQLPVSMPAGSRLKPEALHLWLRVLFSCLVDADFLDTENFMTPDSYALRGHFLSLETLKEKFDVFMDNMSKNAQDSQINRYRRQILSQCREKGKLPPGFYSLTVPTGGGKTLSAMAFALEHAVKYRKDRVIMAIPYTSIIEQTAKVYKYGSDDDSRIDDNIKSGSVLFGEENVLEHHSNVNPEKESYKHMLAAQNWDAPIIVTTNVQLLQSLHASHTSSCRKLHNIVNSVVIIDEAQMLPASYMEPVIAALKALVENFSVTVVFCTATQPALTGNVGSSLTSFNGIERCVEITENVDEIMNNFKRVQYTLKPEGLSDSLQWMEIAEELSKEKQVLCIVNTRKDCRDLHSLMPEGTLHLSGFMCGEEISSLISEIKRKLRNGEDVRVISTQLVECGVDISFPVVWRAIAGLDSITQAAGRCNREGCMHGFGRVVIFVPPSALPPGDIKTGAQITETMIQCEDINSVAPKTFTHYFKQFYAAQRSLDKPDFKNMLVNEAMHGKFQFRSFASQFKIIDSASQRTLLVQYEGKHASGAKLIDELRNFGPSRTLMAKLQRFSVNIPVDIFSVLCNNGAVEVVSNCYVLAQNFYVPGKGVVIDNSAWKPVDYIV